MNILAPLKNQRGFFPLLIGVILVVGGTAGYLGTRVAQGIEQQRGSVIDRLGRGEDVSEEDLERARRATLTQLQVGRATGSLIVAADPTPDDTGGAAISAIAGGLIENGVDSAVNTPPTQSNTPPSDIQTPPSCSGSNLSACLRRSTCTTAGGYWWSNNTCHSTAQNGCDSSHRSLCTSETNCNNAGGFWYSGGCHSSSESGCDSTHLYLCASLNYCTIAGGYWYDSGCHTTPQQDPCNGAGTFSCSNGTTICADLACNGTNNCGDNSDESSSTCGNEDSCCVATNGCPSETATSCGETCCCCPYGQACDRANPANGCVAM